MTHILVVGGAGAMGRHVIQRLLNTTGASITVPTRTPESAHAVGLAASAPGRVELVRFDPAALDALVGNADRVFANTDFFATGAPWASTGKVRICWPPQPDGRVAWPRRTGWMGV
ncbi:NmrA family NAD(P)-binding protein [Streptomyces yatensis]|uniref:NAD-dependent epimerase/dehydratase domain-containing protein n=1 Tax=Streptomyces yatensis TaxID=155177 RepID=A0ABP4UK12_9ACTN|nr:NmrA family NAD(P)-binding protein [Streptomyces yatensis]